MRVPFGQGGDDGGGRDRLGFQPPSGAAAASGNAGGIAGPVAPAGPDCVALGTLRRNARCVMPG